MTRILVTGATTPLGAELVNQLLDDPRVEHVLAVGLEPDAVPAHCTRDRFSYRRCDLSHVRPLRDLLAGPARELAIDTVVHAAFHRDVSEPSHALHVEGTRLLLVEAERHPTIRRFVLRSAGSVYALRTSEPHVIDEDTPLELDPHAPPSLRERVEADLTTCAHLGRPNLSVAILRCAEVLAPDEGSQLHDYLRSRICLRPLGFDPMINVLSIEDCARAHHVAALSTCSGVFNIAGADTLPLSTIVELEHRRAIPVPGPLLAPLYALRTITTGRRFRYDLNRRRFHFGGVLDGRRAVRELGFRAEHPIWHVQRSTEWN